MTFCSLLCLCRPEDLIKDLRDSVVPGTGRIVIAVVLPFRPSVEVGSKWVAPSQRLPVTGSTAHQHAKSFAKDVFEPLGMKVEAISRVRTRSIFISKPLRTLNVVVLVPTSVLSRSHPTLYYKYQADKCCAQYILFR